MKRDYIFIRDAVRGYMMAAEKMHSHAVQGEAFNFGFDRPLMAIEMIKTIIQLSDHPDLEPIILNEAKNEIQDQYLCSDKAGQVLGWEPQYTLESGLTETIQWYRDFFAGVKEATRVAPLVQPPLKLHRCRFW